MKSKAVFLLLLGASLLFYAAWWKSPMLELLDLKIYDALVQAKPKIPETHGSVIVEIDEKSLEALGQWPWPRVVVAELIKKTAALEPSAIAMDTIFPEPDRTSPEAIRAFYRDFFHLDVSLRGLPAPLENNDRILAEAIGAANVTLPVFFESEGAAQEGCFFPPPSVIPLSVEGLYRAGGILCNLSVLQRAAAGIGHIQAAPDADGTLRRTPLFIGWNHQAVPALGVAALLTLDPSVTLASLRRNGGIEATVLGRSVQGNEKGEVLLRFYPRQWYTRVSALDLLRGEADPERFRGKVVLIGASAMGLYDRYTLSDGSIRPGVVVHATLVENLLEGSLIVQPERYKEVALLLSLVLAFVLAVLMRLRRYGALVIFFLAAGMALIGAGIGMLEHNVYVSAGYFLFPLASYLLVLAAVSFVIHYRDRKRFFEKMSKADEAIIDSMALVAETRDTETGAHIVRTKEYIRLLAEHLAEKGFYPDILTPEYITDLYHAAPLHDVGKVGIPDEILKKNAKLTTEEFEVMKTHTTLGKEIIDNAMSSYQNTGMLKIAYNIARGHHEKWDGSGYPAKLKEEQIPLEARLMALADVYDALISRRRYKDPFGYEEAEELIMQGRGGHFDPTLVDAFWEVRDAFRAIAERSAAAHPSGEPDKGA